MCKSIWEFSSHNLVSLCKCACKQHLVKMSARPRRITAIEASNILSSQLFDGDDSDESDYESDADTQVSRYDCMQISAQNSTANWRPAILTTHPNFTLYSILHASIHVHNITCICRFAIACR